jgi:seryl-tRNA synthetase
MIDIHFIRDNTDNVKKGVAAKQLDPKIVERVLELDAKRRVLLGEVESLRAERNKVAKASGPLGQRPGGEKNVARGKQIKEALQEKEPELKKLATEYENALYVIPNLPAADVKVGKNENDNEIVRAWGTPPKFDFKPKDHSDLGEALGILDVKRAAKVSGARFTYMKGDAVLLEFALVRFALEKMIKGGFVPVIPPVLIKKEAMQGMGYLEHDGEEDMYVLDKDGMVLVGTSEQSIGPMHRDEIFNAKDLPLRYVGFSTCFRREAGSYGKDTKGILRTHQFDKVEMFSFTRPKEGDKEHDYLLKMEEELLQALEIPYRVVKMCSGDLGAPAARKFDLEAWMPGQEKYREVTSASTTTDFQSRRLNIKYREGNDTKYVHMLNGTAFAIGRTIIAILENYQTADGSVRVPNVLREYLGKDIIKRT